MAERFEAFKFQEPKNGLRMKEMPEHRMVGKKVFFGSSERGKIAAEISIRLVV